MKTLSWIRQRQPLWMPALATVAAMALAGCATLAAPPEKVVEKRATEYWKARIAGDYAKAYSLSTPAYRKVQSLSMSLVSQKNARCASKSVPHLLWRA